MTIINKTTCTIFVGESDIRPNETVIFWDGVFTPAVISSELGACVVSTEFTKRKFYNQGKMKAREIDEKDSVGMKKIIVEETY